jgi:hypothetical protein
MTKAQLFWDSKIEAYRLKIHGEWAKTEKIVNFLKTQIPHSDRSLDVVVDPNGKKDYTWTFTEKYFDGTVQFLRLVFNNPADIAIITRQQVEAAQQPRQAMQTSAGTPQAQMCYEFMKAIPYEAARQAYRKAASLLHPDVNKTGDMGDMSQVNALWTRIEKEIYGQ